ncbi:MAG: G8 domain-containing protein, partial [Bacteroidia bacterium]
MKTFTAMKNKILVTFALWLFCLNIFCATINSNQSGNWNNVSTWQGGVIPVIGSDVIILSGHTVTLDVNSSNLNSITISSGASLILNSNSFSLKVTNGGTKLTTINGTLTLTSALNSVGLFQTTTLTIANGGVFTNSCGKANSVSITNFNVNSGGVYNHDATGSGTAGSVTDFPGCSGASVNNITIGATSTVNITKWGANSQSPPALPTNASSGISYGFLNINIGTSWSGSWQLGSSGTAPCIGAILGDLKIQATGGQEMRMVSSGNPTNYTLNISGDLNVSGGTFVLEGGGSSAAQTAFYNIAGNMAISGGTVDMNSNQNAVAITLNLSGNLTISGSGSLLRTKSASATVNFKKTSGTQTFSSTVAGISGNNITWNVGSGSSANTLQLNSDFIMSPNSNLFVLNNSTLDCGTFIIRGTTAGGNGNFVLNSGASIKIGSIFGITASLASTSGNVQTGAGKTFNTGANYIYTGSSNQVTGDGLPSTVNKFTISNTSAATTSLTNDVTISSDITINSGATLDVSSLNKLINLKGNWINNGTFNSQTGKVALTGATQETISGTSTTSFYNLTLNNLSGAKLISNENVAGTLQLDGGTFDVNNKVFTLIANAASSGNIGNINSSADIIGNVTIQQCATGGYTGWALLGEPVTSALTMADWNDNFAITCLTCPDGFPSNFSSIYSYSEAAVGTYSDAAKYIEISNITDPINYATGYWVYLGNATSTTTAIMFDVTGTVAKAQNSPINIPLSYTNQGSPPDDGWNLISNPLPSPILWSQLKGSTTNIDDAIYVYNTDLNNGAGGFASYISGVSSPAVGVGGVGDSIPMCQGFYVHSTGATSLSAQESNKVGGTPVFLKNCNNAQNNQTQKPIARLFLSGANSKDETVFYFESGATQNFETNRDAYKLINDISIPYLASMAGTLMCNINGLPALP